MKIDHVHFYVEDAEVWRDWFVQQLGFQAVAVKNSNCTCTEVVQNGPVYFVLSSPLTSLSPVADFLKQHPPGVADVALIVENLQAVMTRAVAYGARVLKPVQQHQTTKGYLKSSKIAAWGSLSHTLIEAGEQGGTSRCAPLGAAEIRQQQESSIILSSFPPAPLLRNSSPASPTFTGIDHIVLNVASSELENAVDWYQNILGFHAKQTFKIQTDRSALHSQVMVSHNKLVQLAINQPTSPNSQIQEFLDTNRGPGIQHIALRVPNIVQVIKNFRKIGVSFLSVPPIYYTQLLHRQGFPLSSSELEEIAQQQILIDWEETSPQSVLLQTFTQPIFEQPTFFFELIERRFQAQGFGEGNFRALFEAIEREQIKRRSLQ